MMTGLIGQRVLHPDGSIRPASWRFESGRLAADTPPVGAIDAGRYLVLPGMVDLHGDAFERQISPRPEVGFNIPLAILDTDRQLLANGITTAFHGITWSWEGGLRGRSNAMGVMYAIRRPGNQLGADHKIHLRFETYNLDAVEEVALWLASGLIDFLAFNDHMPTVQRYLDNDSKLRKFSERAGLSLDDFRHLVELTVARKNEIPEALLRLAQVAQQHHVPMASHDDYTPQERHTGQEMGITICEFPRTMAAANAAHELNNPIILGAPNVVLGGSHCNAVDARTMIEEQRCDILASDYYYPAMLQAVFRLVQDERLTIAEAWNLVCRNPARAAGLHDRGEIASGQRADLILVDDQDPSQVRVVATIVNGELRYAATDLPRGPQTHELQPLRDLLGATC